MKLTFYVLFLSWWVLLALFYLFPKIDIATTNPFFLALPCSPAEAGIKPVCGYFPAARNGVLVAARDILHYLPLYIGLTLIYRLIRVWSEHGATYNRDLSLRLQAGLVSLFLGPGLLINILLKQISHRPRPRNTDLFSGNLPFVPAGDFSGACTDNCSFISGEAAGGGWIFCYTLFLLPQKYRLICAPPLFVISFAMPIMRLTFGGHYLSDVILGWLAAVVIFLGTWYIFTKPRRPALKPA